MNKKNLIRSAAFFGIAAAAAVVLARSGVSIDMLLGYGAVLGLLVGVAAEYRLNRRTAFGR